MSYIYAIQVKTGMEIQAKKMVETVLKKYNPGIAAVYAFESFTQVFKSHGRAPKELHSKVPGYIFVETNKTEGLTSADGSQRDYGLGMDASCWQLLKSIPLITKVLNRYIAHDEWGSFFNIIDLEPEVEITDKDANSSLESKLTMIKRLIKEKKQEFISNKLNMLKKIRTVARCSYKAYSIPYSLFEKARDSLAAKGITSRILITNYKVILPVISSEIEALCYG